MGSIACGEVSTYSEDAARLAAVDPRLAAEIAEFTGIAQVIDWFSRHGDGKPAIDLIGMDEFEYDFLVQTDETGPWLSFGVT